MESDSFNGDAFEDDLDPVESAKRILRENAPFDIVNFGTLDRIELVSKPEPKISDKPKTFPFELPLNALPFGPPPVFQKTKQALLEYLEHPERLPIYDLDKTQSFVPREPCPETLFHHELAPLRSNIKVVMGVWQGVAKTP
jgi:hypothetical protein